MLFESVAAAVGTAKLGETAIVAAVTGGATTIGSEAAEKGIELAGEARDAVSDWWDELWW